MVLENTSFHKKKVYVPTPNRRNTTKATKRILIILFDDTNWTTQLFCDKMLIRLKFISSFYDEDDGFIQAKSTLL